MFKKLIKPLSKQDINLIQASYRGKTKILTNEEKKAVTQVLKDFLNNDSPTL